MTMLTDLLEARTGQEIAANRSWRIETALRPLMRERHLASLDALVAAMIADGRGTLERAIVDALLNQETSFFRDMPVLESIVGLVGRLQTAGLPRQPRIWSAACSTGQEPLSLAMMFAERLASTGLAEPEIIATDVSEAALTRSRAGRYSQFEIQRGLPVRQMIDWFQPIGQDWAAKPALVQKIAFRQHNLMGDSAPAGRFDVVLCRNVLIYLSPARRRHVFDMIARVIRPGGCMVLGAGETALGYTDMFVPSSDHRGVYIAVPAGLPGVIAG
ncbi:MAG: CheR family methyltransferase [Sphingomonas sp.]